MENTVKQRIIEFISYKRIGQGKFEKSVGLSNGYLNKLRHCPSEEKLQKIIGKYPELNKNWLLTGEGSMLKDVTPSPSKKTIRYWTDVDVTGGGLQLYDDTMNNNRVDMTIPSFSDCTDAVNIYGDSMEPLYKSGQIILLKEWTENFIEYGRVYLVITKCGNRMVKCLRKSDTEGKVICASENPKYEPFEIESEDIIKLYIVKGGIYRDAQ